MPSGPNLPVDAPPGLLATALQDAPPRVTGHVGTAASEPRSHGCPSCLGAFLLQTHPFHCSLARLQGCLATSARRCPGKLQRDQNVEQMLGTVVTAKPCPGVPALPRQPEVQPPGVAASPAVRWVLLDPCELCSLSCPAPSLLSHGGSPCAQPRAFGWSWGPGAPLALCVHGSQCLEALS